MKLNFYYLNTFKIKSSFSILHILASQQHPPFFLFAFEDCSFSSSFECNTILSLFGLAIYKWAFVFYYLLREVLSDASGSKAAIYLKNY